jgi:hypothetical protein
MNLFVKGGENLYKFGIGFWCGGGIYSLINMIMNLNHSDQNSILNYNYIITCVAVFGLILNMFLLRKAKRNR